MKGQVICKLNEAIQQQRMLFQQENEEEEEEKQQQRGGGGGGVTSHPASTVRNRSPSQIHRTIQFNISVSTFSTGPLKTGGKLRR